MILTARQMSRAIGIGLAFVWACTVCSLAVSASVAGFVTRAIQIRITTALTHSGDLFAEAVDTFSVAAVHVVAAICLSTTVTWQAQPPGITASMITVCHGTGVRALSDNGHASSWKAFLMFARGVASALISSRTGNRLAIAEFFADVVVIAT